MTDPRFRELHARIAELEAENAALRDEAKATDPLVADVLAENRLPIPRTSSTKRKASK